DIVGGDTMNGRIQAGAAQIAELQGHVTFHGVVPHDTVQTMIARTHLHLMSSRHEAAGVAVLEAAAAGVPTVGTRVGYVADWSPDAAVAVEPGDANALAAGVLELLAQPAKRWALGEQA